MVDVNLKYGLPFCSVTLEYKGKSMILDSILIDTGSAGTVFKMDKVDEIGITIENDDIIESISGVGGAEFVYKKKIDSIKLGDLITNDLSIEIGVMDYGFDLNGIVGMDFLQKVGAVIDLNQMKIFNSKDLKKTN